MAEDQLKFPPEARTDLVNVSTEASDDSKNSDSASASHAVEKTSTSGGTESSAEVNLPSSGSSNVSGIKDSSSAAKHSAVPLRLLNLACPTCVINTADKDELFMTPSNPAMFGRLPVIVQTLGGTVASLPQIRRLTQEEFAKKFPNWCWHMYSGYLTALKYASQMGYTLESQQSDSQRQDDSNVQSPCTNKSISTTERTKRPLEHHNHPVASSSNQSGNEDPSSAMISDVPILCDPCGLKANNEFFKSKTEPKGLTKCHSAANDVINSAQLSSRSTVDRTPEEFVNVKFVFSHASRFTRDDLAKIFPNACEHMFSYYVVSMDDKERARKKRKCESSEGSSSSQNLPSSSASLSNSEAISQREFISSPSMEEEVTLQHAEPSERNPVSQHSENVGQDEVSSTEDTHPQVLEAEKKKSS